MKEIEGTIKYKITIKDGNWDLNYTQSSENDLAILAIGWQLMEYSEVEFEKSLKDKDLKANTHVKRSYKDRLVKVRAAKFGLRLMCEYLMSVIDEYHAFVEENKKNEGIEPLPPTEKEKKKIVKMMEKLKK